MRQSVAAIALICREQDGQTQWLAQWNDAWGALSFVGGHKNDDESFRECLIREIKEELGLVGERQMLVSAAPVKHLEYSDFSQRAGEETDYTIELFNVSLIGDGVWEMVDANSANRWLTEDKIMACRTHDGRPVSPMPKRCLRALG